MSLCSKCGNRDDSNAGTFDVPIRRGTCDRCAIEDHADDLAIFEDTETAYGVTVRAQHSFRVF